MTLNKLDGLLEKKNDKIYWGMFYKLIFIKLSFTQGIFQNRKKLNILISEMRPIYNLRRHG